ncbi:MAG: hypothetical protein K0U74_11450 [Alphaproteobacteria bacterium]|nr:hypothetical protein [Alphaproteobacteria bacterium]
MPGLFGRFSLLDVLVYFGVVFLAIILVRLFAPRYYDQVVAFSALGFFIAFLAIVGIWVDSISLKIVLGIAALMATYDFWLDAFSGKNNGNGSGNGNSH